MAFTDDDLKRLKDSLEAGCILTDTDMNLPALLARLEAAELVIQAIQASCGSIEFFLENASSIPNWLKSKGDGRAG